MTISGLAHAEKEFNYHTFPNNFQIVSVLLESKQQGSSSYNLSVRLLTTPGA